MTVPAVAKAVVVVGTDAELVAGKVSELRAEGLRVAGFVGDDEEAAAAMAAEMLGGADEVVRV